MNKFVLFTLSLLALTAFGLYGGSSVSKVSAATQCNIVLVDGGGNNGIKITGDNKAKVTVKVTGPKGCTVPVTLALWDAKNPSGLPLNKQTLDDSKTKIYGPGTYTMGIPIDECMNYQVDLLYQTNPKSVVNGNANYQLPKDKLANFKLGSTKCIPPPAVDVCPNIAGNQATIPAGMIKDASGNCVTPTGPVDVCPNIAGMQTEVPAGYYRDASGNCVINPIPGDVCPNIDGKQTEIPAGMIKDANGNCVTPVDVCPNIAGMQAEVPAGMIKDANGNCVMAPVVVTPVTTQPTTLPRTGPVDAAAALGGTGLMASAAGSYIRSRRSLIKSLLFRK